MNHESPSSNESLFEITPKQYTVPLMERGSLAMLKLPRKSIFNLELNRTV